MKNYLYHHLVLVFVVILALFAVIILFTTSSNKKTVSPSPTPNPANINDQPASDGGVTFTNTTQDQQQKTIGYNVTQLIKKLPYTGSNFSLDYDFPKNQFTLTLRQASGDEAKTEFNNFLKQNGIPDQSWLSNLDIQYK